MCFVCSFSSSQLPAILFRFTVSLGPKIDRESKGRVKAVWLNDSYIVRKVLRSEPDMVTFHSLHLSLEIHT